MSEALATNRDDELAALIAEQESDDQWGHKVGPTRAPTNLRAVSLDYSLEDGATLGEFVGKDDAQLESLIGGAATAVRRIPRPQRWTRRQIVSAIRKWVKEHGELPRYTDWNYPNGRGIPSAASVARRFGSWNAGIRAAGFEGRPAGSSPHSVTRTLRPRMRKQKRTARLTSADLAAAYVLYDRRGLSLPELAELLWQKYGYPSPLTCKAALHKGFHAEGFRLRTKSEARMLLSPEHRARIAANARAARSYKHLTQAEYEEIRRRRTKRQADLAVEYGVSQSTISRVQRNLRRPPCAERRDG